SALSKSHTVSQFKTHLNAVVQKQPFDNKTKQLIREFLKGFDDDPPPSPPSGGDGGPAGPTPPTTPPKGDIEGTNPKGNEPQNPTSGLEQAWLETFGLKSLDEPFIPKFSPEVAKALEPVLKGEQIQLTQGSLIKLEKRQREEFLPLIRPTLEEPNAVLDDGKGLLFIKEFIDPDKNRYFMSVAKNYDGEWVFSSHVRKDFSGIKKKFADSKVLYNAGFKGGEVAGASDILESGGTAVKPSDLQIDTPPNRGSGLNPKSEDTTSPLQTDLSTQEIKQAVKKWDLANPKPTDSLDFALVKDPELRELQEVFNTDKLIRQLRSAEVKDTLDKGFSLKEVLDYTSHLPTAQRNILGDELHYTKPLENGKTLNIVETYKAPKTLRFSRMDVVEDRGVPPPQTSTEIKPKTKMEPGDDGLNPPKGLDPSTPATNKTPNSKGDGNENSTNGRIDNQEASDLLDPTKPLRKAKPEEITPELLNKVKESNTKVWVGDFMPQDKALEAKLGFDPKYPVKITFNGDALKHVEKNHGINSMHHKQNKQPPIELEDIRDYAEIVNHADRYKVETDKYGQEVLIAGKQNNGYAIVIETISTKKNELKLKTFYKENGKLEKNPIFRDSGLSSQLPKDSEGSLSPKPSANLDVPPQTAKADSTTTPLKIEANPAFGENFAEYAGKGAEAVKKLLEEKRGQVSGAFYR
ncbi:PBECR2 nuclease fold domain-containing protein, partial [Helicobacter ailurogastricus]|uniref:PBECR3 domain-containing polyvalent protein n=1 Tax=Helicobacter ailurogastricus TaxID=1578720 RepID=UPI002552CB0D